jgi:hypothetical protein
MATTNGVNWHAQDILADHLGFTPSRPLTIRYRDHAPARWTQGKPWRTTSAEIDAFLSDPEIH